MATRCDDLTVLLYLMDASTRKILNDTAENKIITDQILADPDFLTDLTASEQAYVTAINGHDATATTDFALLTYTLTTTAGANGSVLPNGAVLVPYATGQLFTATPDALYEVDEWTVDSISVQTGGTTLMLDPVYSDLDVNVTFKLIP